MSAGARPIAILSIGSRTGIKSRWTRRPWPARPPRRQKPRNDETLAGHFRADRGVGFGPRSAARVPPIDRARAGRVRRPMESPGDGWNAAGGRRTAASATDLAGRSHGAKDDAVRLSGADGGGTLAR